MKHIIFPIAVFALFLVSCNNGNETKTENDTTNTEEVANAKDILLVSKIDVTDNESGEKSGVTLKYDNENRLVEMIPTGADVPTKISYDGNNITVTNEYSIIKYEINGEEITETESMDGEELSKIVYKIDNGKIKESKDMQSSIDIKTTYKWENNCIMEEIKTITDMGDASDFTTKYKYGNARNIFNIDIINILEYCLFDEPGIGSLADGFLSEFLPEEITWEGIVDGCMPTKNTFTYKYVYDGELISEIHISLTHITTDDDDNEEVEKTSQTVKITY